jgi:hypothetical protein
MNKYLLLILFVFLLVIPYGFADSNTLDFDVIKTKTMDVNVLIEIPIHLDSYTSNSSFSLTTPVFIDTRNQKVDLEAYYYKNNQKVFAEFFEDDYENRFALFQVDNIDRDEYIFYIDARVVSENKIIFSDEEYLLTNEIEEYLEYKKSTRYINSDKSEIISISNFLKKSDNALKELTNIVDWTYKYIEYDISYSNRIVEATNVLFERRGVCSEFSILAAAILRARGFPTRYVTGYASSTVEWQPHAWLEVYIPNQGWIFVDPTFGEVGLVDASHLLISKSFDPSEIKDKVTAYGDIFLRFGEKKATFKINEHKSFSDLGYSNAVSVDFIYPDKIKQNSAFFITAKIRNTTSRPLSMLFILSVHSDFKLIYPDEKNILYLSPFGEEEITFYLISENINVPLNHISRYGFTLISQITDFSGELEIYRDQGYFQEAFFVTKPLFFVNDDLLTIDFDVINYTNKIKNIDFDINNNGVLETKEVSVLSNTVYNFSEKYQVLKDTKFFLESSGDYSFSESFFIFKDQIIVDVKPIDTNLDDTIVDINLIDENRVDENNFRNGSKEIETNNSLIIGIVIIVVFILFTIFVFLSKNKKKEGL